MAWDLLCRPNMNGGIGFKELLSWNKAFMSKRLGKLATNHQTRCCFNGSRNINWSEVIYGQLRVRIMILFSGKNLLNLRDELLQHVENTNLVSLLGSKTKLWPTQVYDLLRTQYNEVTWHEVMWCKLNMPRTSMVCRLACLDRLYTLNWLKSFRLVTVNTCCLCGQIEKSVIFSFDANTHNWYKRRFLEWWSFHLIAWNWINGC